MSKRGNNEGSIYKRTDGRWAATLTLGYENGKRKRKSYYGQTRREVQEQLTQALRTVQQGLPVTPERQTVGPFLNRWLQDSVQPTVRPRTYDSYSEIARLHLIPELGRVPLAKLTPQNVQALLAKKLASGLSPRRVQYIRAVLRRALGQALKWGLVGRNVATLVDSPRVEHPEIQPLTPTQARTLLEAAKGDRFEALYILAIALGMRQGELLGLRWAYCDLDSNVLRVSVTLQRIQGKFQLVEPKTERSRRTLNLPDIAVRTLKSRRLLQFEERLAAGEHWTDTGLVFTTGLGTPLDTGTVIRGFQRLLRRAGLPHVRFHDLRHTCASLLLSQGTSPRMIMEILGHSQIATTMDIYSHIMPAMREEAARQMDDLLLSG